MTRTEPQQIANLRRGFPLLCQCAEPGDLFCRMHCHLLLFSAIEATTASSSLTFFTIT
jgi:hypothetical protein